MKKIWILVAVSEILTGLALLIVPALVGQLLFGADMFGIATIVARAMGFALVALGIACWPGTPLIGMLCYSAGIAGYFAYLGFMENIQGLLLWPAVVVHVIFSVLLLRILLVQQPTKN
jgi:hypothetical protein